MTREIKFRAYTKETPDKYRTVEFDLEDLMYGTHDIRTVDLKYWEVCQYTGLLDKNGKPIYEGDVIKLSCHPEHEGLVAEVKWYHDGWHYTIDNDDLHAKDRLSVAVNSVPPSWLQPEEMQHHYKCQVIGNIYENPELLK
jgi:uncharacterized phage protein (TIGR01671 family)